MRVLLAALLLLAVAGCGGGGDNRLTKDELIQQADAVCVD